MPKLFSPSSAEQSAGGLGGTQIPAHPDPSSPSSSPQPVWLAWLICVVLAAMVWTVFGQTRHFEFTNYDDPTYVFANPALNQGLKWDKIVWVFTHENEHEWFPVTYLSRMLDSQLYGAKPGGPHVTNILLHTATVILLFLVLRRLTGQLWPAAFVAAVFAIHPLRAESVAWVVERKDVLSGFFGMLTLLYWTRYVQGHRGADPASPPQRWLPGYFLALLFFTLGLLSKSILVTLPCVMLLLDFWPLQRLSLDGPGGLRSVFRAFSGLFLEKVPFLILSVAACVTTALTEKNIVSAVHGTTPLWRIANVLIAYVEYIKHLVYPVGLTVIYSHPDANPPLWLVGLSAAILLLVTVLALAGWRRQPWLLVGWFWYLGMLLPVIDSMQLTFNVRADRYTYLPQIGLVIMITWSVANLSAIWPRRQWILGFAAVAILASLMVGAYVQTTYWHDSVTLWNRSLACTPNNYFAENSLGTALNNLGRWDDAVPHLKRSLELKADDLEAEVNLGVALDNQGKLDEAITHFESALQLNPNSAAAHYNLGHALLAQDKPAEAIPHLQQALQLQPGYTDAHYDLGLALASQQQWTEALTHFQAALHLPLDDTDAHYIVALNLATHKKWAAAIVLYQQVLQKKPDFAEAHNNLGLALASLGETAEAAQEFQTALTLATAQDNATLANSIRARLKSNQ